MLVLLDALGAATDAAKAVAQDGGKSTLAMVASIAGSIYGTAKIVHWFEERRRAKAMAAVGPVAPKEQESPEAAAAREELLRRAHRAETESALGRTLWRLDEAEASLQRFRAEATEEMNRLRNALTRETEMRIQLKRMNDDLRADNAGLRDDVDRLRAELDAALIVTDDDIVVDTLTDDAAHEERIATPLLPPPSSRKTKS